MSADGAVMGEKNKLMEILEEELSALNLRKGEIGETNRSESKNLQNTEEIEIGDKQDNVISSSDKTAEVLQKTVDNENEECKTVNKAFNPPRATNEDVLKQKNGYENRKYIFTEKVPNHSSGVALKQYLQENCIHEKKSIDNEKLFVLPSDSLAEKNIDEDILKQKNESENRKYVFTENVPSHSSGVAVEQYLQQNCIDERKPIDNEELFVPPSDSLAEKIMRRAELIFQDYNIFKNSYLLNLVMRNKKGFVSLKVIASLRKLRTLTKDYRVIMYSLMKSNILELNPDKTKVRRIELIPKIESTNFGKTVMIFNIPQDIQSNDSLKEFFSKFGTVVSAGLFEINSPESNAYHKRCLFFHRKISSKTYGIVEFENYDEVVAVFKDGDGLLPKENDMKVVPLMPQIYKKERKYLKFVEQYNKPYPRREFGWFKRRDFGAVKQEAPVRNEENGEIIKHGNMNMGTSNGGSGEVFRNEKGSTGSYYRRGYFRRPYRYRKTFTPPNSQNYIDGQANNDYYGKRNYRWEEGRHLKMNNSMNVDRLYPNNRNKPGYAYVEN